MEIIKLKNYNDIEKLFENEKKEVTISMENCEIKDKKKVFNFIKETNLIETLKKIDKNTFYIKLKEKTMNETIVNNSRRVSDFLGFKVQKCENLYKNSKASEFIKKYDKYLNTTKKEEFREFFYQTGIILEHIYLFKSRVISFNMFGARVNRNYQVYNSHLQILTRVEQLEINDNIIYANGKEVYNLKNDEENKEKLEHISHINDWFCEKIVYGNEVYENEKQCILGYEMENIEHHENTQQRILDPYGDIFYLTEDGILYCNDKEYDKDVETVWEQDRYNKLIIFKDNKVEYLSATFGGCFDEVYDKVLYGENYLALLKDKKLKIIVRMNPDGYKIESTESNFSGIDDIEIEINEWDEEELIMCVNGSRIKCLIPEVQIQNDDQN